MKFDWHGGEIMFRYFVLAAIWFPWISPAHAQHAVNHPSADSMSMLLPEVTQSPEAFARAVRDTSTAPRYVRIKVNGGPETSGRLSCILGSDLNLAIRREHNLSSDDDAIEQAARIATANPDHTFMFANASALEIVMPKFSQADFARIRSELAPLSNDELRAGFSLKPWGTLHQHFRTDKDRAAAACVLIERHMSPGLADRTGSLYIKD